MALALTSVVENKELFLCPTEYTVHAGILIYNHELCYLSSLHLLVFPHLLELVLWIYRGFIEDNVFQSLILFVDFV